MKKQLQKKIYAFVILIMFSVSANAQIIYTDLDPDITRAAPNNPAGAVVGYSIDFNNDGILDVTLSANRTPSNRPIQQTVYTTPISTSEVLTTFLSNRTYGLNLGANSLIEDISQTWSSLSARLRSNSNICPGCWPLNLDYFLGTRFSMGGDWFYGWVRISVLSSNSFTVRDYAYNSTPNQPILAGETGTLGLNENDVASQISIFPNPAANQLTISLGSLQPEVEVSIADITGKTVYKIKESEAQNIELNTTDFESGIYLVQIKATDFIETKKLIVKK